MIRIVLALLAAALAVPAHAQSPVMQAPSASYRAGRAPRSRPRRACASKARRWRTASSSRARGATERAKLAALNGNRGSALAAPGTPQFIGFGRDVAADKRRVDLASLTWTPLADGARVARIEVASPGAAGIRVAVRMPATHPDVTVRFAGRVVRRRRSRRCRRTRSRRRPRASASTGRR